MQKIIINNNLQWYFYSIYHVAAAGFFEKIRENVVEQRVMTAKCWHDKVVKQKM
jgi:hypothetical protein